MYSVNVYNLQSMQEEAVAWVDQEPFVPYRSDYSETVENEPRPYEAGELDRFDDSEESEEYSDDDSDDDDDGSEDDAEGEEGGSEDDSPLFEFDDEIFVNEDIAQHIQDMAGDEDESAFITIPQLNYNVPWKTMEENEDQPLKKFIPQSNGQLYPFDGQVRIYLSAIFCQRTSLIFQPCFPFSP